MLKIKEEKDFNCYEDYQGYVQSLISQGVLCEGCTYCMTNGCNCSLGDAVEHSKGDWVYCTPMGDIPEGLSYPVSCIKEQYGENSLYCSHCQEIIPYEKWDYAENNNKVCPYCGGELEEF